MPAPLDLAGRRFGRLTILTRAGSVRYGLRQTAWLCRCDCGTEITLPRARLPYRASMDPRQIVDACPACRLGRSCVVCGIPFVPSSSRVITCSQMCRAENNAENRRQRQRRRAQDDPESLHAEQARYRARIAADPERRARREALRRERYRRDRDRINEQRRGAKDAMSPEEREAHLRRIRAYMRRYKRRYLEEVRADADRHRALLDRTRDWRRRRALADLAALATELEERL